MVEKGGTYAFAGMPRSDRGWVFCPEYMGAHPLEISPAEWDTRIFLFGPALLPDSEFRRDSVTRDNLVQTRPSVAPSAPEEAKAPEAPSVPDSIKAQASVPSGGTRQEPVPSGKGTEGAIEPRICLGTDLLTGGKVDWPLTVKGNPHLLIAGLPGMGKTTCLLNLCTQMLDAGIRPIVFSYHQDIDDELQRLVGSIRFIDFRGLGFNPLQVMDRSSQVAYLDVAGALRDIFVAIFPELGDIQGERIRRAVKESFVEKGWDEPNADQNELEEPEFGRFVAILRDTPKIRPRAEEFASAFGGTGRLWLLCSH